MNRLFKYLRTVFDESSDGHEFFWRVELKLALREQFGYALPPHELAEAHDFRTRDYTYHGKPDAQVPLHFAALVCRRMCVLSGLSFGAHDSHTLTACMEVVCAAPTRIHTHSRLIADL